MNTTTAGALAEPYFQTDFTTDEFIARRSRVMDAMEGRGIALLGGEPEPSGYDPFRQNNDFYYLCGVETPHAYLLIDAQKRRATLYLPAVDARHVETDGPTLSVDCADFVRARTGVDEVKLLAALPDDLRQCKPVWLARAFPETTRACQDTLRYSQKCIDADPLSGRPAIHNHLLARVAGLCPSADLLDLSPILQKLRMIKSAAEIALLRRAGVLSALAVNEAMRGTRPGVLEYQLGALAQYIFAVNGARGDGYRPIIAGGSNIWMMHYWRNNCPLRDGDLVLFDHAPDLNNYTSDIGRMWPVNGKFSPVQRELYGFVVEYHKLLMSLVKPGAVAESILSEAAERIRPRVATWGFSKEIYKTGAMKLLESKRPLSHSVGMAVHDAGNYFGRPMEPGLVFTVDPELVIPEERLYIRCEDTLVVTADGHENLTRLSPLEPDATEKAMLGDGMLRKYPPEFR